MRNSAEFSSNSLVPVARAWRSGAITVSLVTMIVASAYVSIPLPVGPVPMTMQSLAVLMAGIYGGPRVGATACVAYLALCLAGLPVLAGGAMAPALALLARPSAGYLLAFVPATWIAGLLFQRTVNRPVGALVALVVGHVVIFTGGVAYLCTFVPFSQAIAVGVAPFLAGSVIKVLLGVALTAATLPVSVRIRR